MMMAKAPNPQPATRPWTAGIYGRGTDSARAPLPVSSGSPVGSSEWRRRNGRWMWRAWRRRTITTPAATITAPTAT